MDQPGGSREAGSEGSKPGSSRSVGRITAMSLMRKEASGLTKTVGVGVVRR